MLFLVLIPTIPAVWMLAKRSIEDAFVDVYLPTLFLIPTYYVFEIRHVIGFSASEAVIIPITLAGLVQYRGRWRWHRADLWLLLFAAGYGYSIGTSASTGLRAFCQMLIWAVCPYITGKLILGQREVRERVVRRVAWLAAIVAFISIVEFRLGRNLFVEFYSSIFHRGSPNVEQVRYGFERVQGPFEHAIAAGMIFGSVWILAIWLKHLYERNADLFEPKVLGVTRSKLLVIFSLLGLAMAMSIGPWIGSAFALTIASIGPARNARRRTIAVVLFLLVAGSIGYSYLEAYTTGTTTTASSYEQEDAIYRRQLLPAYIPIAESGGLFGFGHRTPVVDGQQSVDNAYLVFWLNQGLWGLGAFLLLAFEAGNSLIRRARRKANREDFHFAMSLLAVLGGMWLTLATVYLQAQVVALYYLCVGWSLAIWDDAGTSEEHVFLREEATSAEPRVFA